MTLAAFRCVRNSSISQNLLRSLKQHHGQFYGKASLQDIGVDLNQMTDFLKSYENLVIEQGRILNGLPTRLRRYAHFTIQKMEDENYFQQNLRTEFKQDVNDDRNKVRIFTPIEEHFLNDKTIQKLLSNMTDIVWEIHPDVIELEMSLHQVRVLTYPNMIGTNSPEGIHQDGADVIVPAIVLNRSPHIVGGVSRIYDADKITKIDETIVEKGEFNFMQDRILWHDVSEFLLNTTEKIGYRDILGIDWKITNRNP